MSGRWFRLYDELLDDPKVQRLPPEAFKVWINVLCLASRNDGCLPQLTALAFALRLDEKRTRKIIDLLIEQQLIDVTETGFEPHKWRDRQYKSDVSTDRVKRHREQRRNVSCNVSEAVVEQPRNASRARAGLTDTETETETESPNPQPQQPATRPAKEAAAAWETGLEQKCREAAGLESDPSPALLVIGPIFDLIQAGWSLEAHILPRLRAVKASGRKGRSWSFYAKIIAEEAQTPPKAQPPPPNGVLAIAESQADIRARFAAKHGLNADGDPVSA